MRLHYLIMGLGSLLLRRLGFMRSGRGSTATPHCPFGEMQATIFYELVRSSGWWTSYSMKICNLILRMSESPKLKPPGPFQAGRPKLSDREVANLEHFHVGKYWRWIPSVTFFYSTEGTSLRCKQTNLSPLEAYLDLSSLTFSTHNIHIIIPNSYLHTHRAFASSF